MDAGLPSDTMPISAIASDWNYTAPEPFASRVGSHAQNGLRKMTNLYLCAAEKGDDYSHCPQMQLGLINLLLPRPQRGVVHVEVGGKPAAPGRG